MGLERQDSRLRRICMVDIKPRLHERHCLQGTGPLHARRGASVLAFHMAVNLHHFSDIQAATLDSPSSYRAHTKGKSSCTRTSMSPAATGRASCGGAAPVLITSVAAAASGSEHGTEGSFALSILCGCGVAGSDWLGCRIASA